MKTRQILMALTLGGVFASSPASAFFGTKKTGEEDKPEVVLSGARQFAEGQPAELRPFFELLWAEGERNAVLNFSRLGLAAMELGRHALAAAAFDEAILRIESIYANDPNAEKAKSLWNAEKVKDFKGEPYERSMTYYYRGLLYLQAGDYQNARAAFQSAERHDSVSEKEQFQSDFGLMNYLAGWATRCDGDASRANEFLEKARAQDATNFASLTLDAPFLVLVDAGPAPVKSASGQHKELLGIAAGGGQADDIRALHESGGPTGLDALRPQQVASVSYQATTRGGRPVQAILDGKAQFKSTAETVGNVALTAGTTAMMTAGQTGDRDAATAGAVIALIGLFSKAVADATTPEADIRSWDTLSDGVHMFPAGYVPVTRPDFTVRFQSGDQERQAPLTMYARHGRCAIGWARTRSALDTGRGGEARMPARPDVAESDRGLKNRAFRAQLATQFAAPVGERSGATTVTADRKE